MVPTFKQGEIADHTPWFIPSPPFRSITILQMPIPSFICVFSIKIWIFSAMRGYIDAGTLGKDAERAIWAYGECPSIRHDRGCTVTRGATVQNRHVDRHRVHPSSRRAMCTSGGKGSLHFSRRASATSNVSGAPHSGSLGGGRGGPPGLVGRRGAPSELATLCVSDKERGRGPRPLLLGDISLRATTAAA